MGAPPEHRLPAAGNPEASAAGEALGAAEARVLPRATGQRPMVGRTSLSSEAGGGLRQRAGGAAPPEYFHSADPKSVPLIFRGGFRTDLPTPAAAWARNRFGRGVYLANSPAAVLAERSEGVVLRVQADLGKNLNIVGRGPIVDEMMAKAIARGARKHGFDSITTSSVQKGGGINTVIFDPGRAIATGVVP